MDSKEMQKRSWASQVKKAGGLENMKEKMSLMAQRPRKRKKNKNKKYV